MESNSIDAKWVMLAGLAISFSVIGFGWWMSRAGIPIRYERWLNQSKRNRIVHYSVWFALVGLYVSLGWQDAEPLYRLSKIAMALLMIIVPFYIRKKQRQVTNDPRN